MKRTKERRNHAVGQHRRQAKARGGQPGGQFEMLSLKVEPRAPSKWPSISVCMIVKNEAENLRPCLESLADLASEVIVVDTGSTDGTAEIARELGAKVYSFPWCDDFAAARNESIRRATGEWVFWMDADDRPSQETIAQIKLVTASGKAGGYVCLVSSKTLTGGDDVTEHIRLFRNGFGVRFSGAIHESVFDGLVHAGLSLARTDITISHVGYSTAEALHRKGKRNLAIIERQLELKPDSVDLIFYRGQARGAAGDLAGAEADMRDFLSRTRPQPLQEWKRSWAYVTTLRILDHRSDLDAMEPLLSPALAEFPDDPHFLLLSARLRLSRGHPEEALPQLQRAQANLRTPVRGFRPPDAWVELSLAECYRALGQNADAVNWAERAIASSPVWAKASSLLARLYLEAGKHSQLERLLEEHLPSSRTHEPWLVLSELRYQQRRTEEAMKAIEEAERRGLPESRADELRHNLRQARESTQQPGQSVSDEPGSELRHQGLRCMSKGELLKAAECFASA
ncbi:MAG: glycosyltransferase, partial [Dehalococcoidales bacterium]|nr:glycosyltransferase [Dehalococcoidales bacterium]